MESEKDPGRDAVTAVTEAERLFRVPANWVFHPVYLQHIRAPV